MAYRHDGFWQPMDTLRDKIHLEELWQDGSAVEMLVKSVFWHGRRVLVTGHTGFKGGWLALWLHQLGAEVTGFALPPPTDPSFFEQARARPSLSTTSKATSATWRRSSRRSQRRPARDRLPPRRAAAGARSYAEPVETYATNVMGTVHVLEACRRADSVRGVVCVTSDKCYENREWVWAYRESDPMGGHDPYSSSKGAAELVVAAYRRVLLRQRAAGSRPCAPATSSAAATGPRTGWSPTSSARCLPANAASDPLARLRPALAARAGRLGGYLLLAERLLDRPRPVRDRPGTSGPPTRTRGRSRWIVERMLGAWGDGRLGSRRTGRSRTRRRLLRLDCSKARAAARLDAAPDARRRARADRRLAYAVDRGGDARDDQPGPACTTIAARQPRDGGRAMGMIESPACRLHDAGRCSRRAAAARA